MAIQDMETICGCASVFWSTVASGVGGLLFGLATAWPRKDRSKGGR